MADSATLLGQIGLTNQIFVNPQLVSADGACTLAYTGVDGSGQQRLVLSTISEVPVFNIPGGSVVVGDIDAGDFIKLDRVLSRLVLSAEGVELATLDNAGLNCDSIILRNRMFDGNSAQILTQQQAAIADLDAPAPPSTTDIANKVNEILAMLRTHGLIAP